MQLDSIDLKILEILQADATTSVQDVADKVGLTNNPCWRRIKKLESSGVILRRSAIINHAAIGLATVAFVSIKIDSHNKEWLVNFADAIESIPEIVECHRMSGDIDYLLKILARDLSHYDSIYQRIITLIPGLKDVSSKFSMEQLKTSDRIGN